MDNIAHKYPTTRTVKENLCCFSAAAFPLPMLGIRPGGFWGVAATQMGHTTCFGRHMPVRMARIFVGIGRGEEFRLKRPPWSPHLGTAAREPSQPRKQGTEKAWYALSRPFCVFVVRGRMPPPDNSKSEDRFQARRQPLGNC